MTNFFKHFSLGLQPYFRAKKPAETDYLNQMAPQVRDSLAEYQLKEIERILQLAVPRPSPKLIDLRFEIDLLISRYFVVLFVGKDRRKSARQRATSALTHWANVLTALVLLIGFNLTVTGSIFMLAYLTKSALGIDLLPGHFRGSFK
jgi:hypothetical protein